MDAPKKEAPRKASGRDMPKMVKVSAVYGRFVDQTNGDEIGATPVEIEVTPWIQVNIDAGKLRLEP